MARLEELPDITDERYKPIWLMAVVRASKELQRTPTTDEIVQVYAELLPKFSAADGTVDPHKKVFVLPGLPYAYPKYPGLILREMNQSDVEVIIPRMAYKSPEDSRRAIMTRFNDPFTQMLAWEFDGRLVQTESLRLMPDHSAQIGTSVHCMPRTARFWREIEKPVFEKLLAIGVTTLSTLTLNTLLDYWKPILLDFYHAKPGRVSPLTTQFSYPIDLSVFTEPEPRRTVPGWVWAHPGTDLVMREMQETEFKSVLRDLALLWGEKHPRLRIVRNILNEQWLLDRSTVLVAYQGDTLVDVFSIRTRRGKDSGHIASCAKESDPETSPLWRVVYRGACEWAFAAGYKTLTNIVPKHIWENPIKRKILQHTRATVVTRRKAWLESVEVTRDLTAIHNESVASWEEWDETRPTLPDFAEILDKS